MELEPEMLATETIVPVYFALEDDELLSIYTQTLTSSSSQGSLSAAEGKYLFPLDLTCCTQKQNMSTVEKLFPDIEKSWCESDISQDMIYVKLLI